MGTVYRGAARPTIVQHGDTLSLVDRGDLFTQEGDPVPRTAVQWERQLGGGGWEVIGPAAVTGKRSRWDSVLPSERNSSLKLGAENEGRKFRVLVYGGSGPAADAGVEWVEWGAADGSHSNDDVPSERSYSEVLTVQPWQTAPPPPAGLSPSEARKQMIAIAERTRFASPAPLSRVAVAHLLLNTPDSVWLDAGQAVPKAIRELLEGGR